MRRHQSVRFDMKRSVYVQSVSVLLAVFGSVLPAQNIPTDVKTGGTGTCPVTAATFSSWFESGMPAPNGIVKPANSITFPATPNCSFYEWSKQMFLWLTSPAPARYGGGAHVFDSAVFYDVSPPDSSGIRTFVPHTPTFRRTMTVRIPPLGAHGLPILFDKSGRLLEVQPAQLSASGRPLVLTRQGSLTEIGGISEGLDRKAIFTDAAGKRIQNLVGPSIKPAAQQRAPADLNRPVTVQQFLIGGRALFVDASGTIIEVEQGQADSGVLQAQNGSLVYYSTMVNQVFAYFLTAAKKNALNPALSHFPTTQNELNQILAFATANGKSLVDPQALAIEVKTSWIEAAGLPNVNTYITATGTIPVYDTSNPNQWTQTGTKTATLALVGMHVVGSTAQHPEMVWATFEHVNNAPNASFDYTNTMNTTGSFTQSTGGNWNFSRTGSMGPFNQKLMRTSGNQVVPSPPSTTIAPSDILRSRPWGMPGNNAGSNTEVISIHKSVDLMMPAGDVRKNYFMTGATWTIPGAPPPGDQVGTNQLANTTMETFGQAKCTSMNQSPCTSFQQGTNCFTCHVTSTTDVSHVFGGPINGQSGTPFGLKPLF
jgi:hypothetical protein